MSYRAQQHNLSLLVLSPVDDIAVLSTLDSAPVAIV